MSATGPVPSAAPSPVPAVVAAAAAAAGAPNGPPPVPSLRERLPGILLRIPDLKPSQRKIPTSSSIPTYDPGVVRAAKGGSLRPLNGNERAIVFLKSSKALFTLVNLSKPFERIALSTDAIPADASLCYTCGGGSLFAVAASSRDVDVFRKVAPSQKDATALEYAKKGSLGFTKVGPITAIIFDPKRNTCFVGSDEGSVAVFNPAETVVRGAQKQGHRSVIFLGITEKLLVVVDKKGVETFNITSLISVSRFEDPGVDVVEYVDAALDYSLSHLFVRRNTSFLQLEERIGLANLDVFDSLHVLKPQAMGIEGLAINGVTAAYGTLFLNVTEAIKSSGVLVLGRESGAEFKIAGFLSMPADSTMIAGKDGFMIQASLIMPGFASAQADGSKAHAADEAKRGGRSDEGKEPSKPPSDLFNTTLGYPVPLGSQNRPVTKLGRFIRAELARQGQTLGEAIDNPDNFYHAFAYALVTKRGVLKTVAELRGIVAAEVKRLNESTDEPNWVKEQFESVMREVDWDTYVRDVGNVWTAKKPSIAATVALEGKILAQQFKLGISVSEAVDADSPTLKLSFKHSLVIKDATGTLKMVLYKDHYSPVFG